MDGRGLKPSTRIFCASCAKDLLNACVAGPLAAIALLDIWRDPNAVVSCAGPLHLLNLPVGREAILACGITCGFFVADCVVLVRYPAEMAKELGGSAPYMIMWLHHVLSLALWPYTLVKPIHAPMITFCLATELTNIGQNAFVLAGRGKLLGDAAEVAIGVLWMLSFFVVRIIPVPAIAYFIVDSHLLTTHSCGLSTAWWWISVTTVPIPVMLNCFWFYKMVRKALRMLGGKGGKGGQKKA